MGAARSAVSVTLSRRYKRYNRYKRDKPAEARRAMGYNKRYNSDWPLHAEPRFAGAVTGVTDVTASW